MAKITSFLLGYNNLLTPRFCSANAGLPGNPLFWRTVLDESDNFAFKTALPQTDGFPKGGPFGAQLWLFHADHPYPVLVGSPSDEGAGQDSNAVVSKGIASAHAEAENLRPENRQRVIDFLKKDGRDGWKIVQVSSGESCPSCRGKQVAFAQELAQQGLVKPKDFHVVFKADYTRTFNVASFNDEPYDTAFRAILDLDVLDHPDGVAHLSDAIALNNTAKGLKDSGQLIYTPVDRVGDDQSLPEEVKRYFEDNVGKPAAIIVSADGAVVLSQQTDNRVSGGINQPEQTAIISAIQAASLDKRAKTGTGMGAWDLGGATIYTNITDIGPLAYAETLWSNIASVKLVPSYGGDTINLLAREVPGIDNVSLFKAVAADYNTDQSPLQVLHMPSQVSGKSVSSLPSDSVAHIYWAAHSAREALLNKQAERLAELGAFEFQYLNDLQTVQLSTLVEASLANTNYDGAQAKP